VILVINQPATEVPVLEEQAMGILRAEFPDLARTYEPDAAHAP
jgi:hypothetical protein